MVLFENVFSALIMRFFDEKLRKFWTLEKLENMMKKEFFSRKKRFHLLKLHLYQIGKAQNTPVVAGRLVAVFNEILYAIVNTLHKITISSSIHSIMGKSIMEFLVFQNAKVCTKIYSKSGKK